VTSPTPSAEPDRVAIKAQIEKTRASFHALVASLSDVDLERKHRGSPWTVGSLLTHCVSAMEIVPRELECVRKGRNFYALPHWLFNPIRLWQARFSAVGQSPGKLIERYNTACALALQALDTVQDDEWQKSARFYDEGVWTIHRIFELQPQHLAEHADEIRAILKRD
jgi:hypothetical protein